ncbi:uncharacterized protein TRIADDRAFT_22762, partial [Trichoplax adhaerens]
WLNKLFRISSNRTLEVEDLYQLSSRDKSDVLLKNFDQEWNKELEIRNHGGKASLFRALVRLFGTGYLLLSIPCFISLAGRSVYPIFIGLLVGCFSPQSTATKTEAYLYTLGLCLSIFFIVIFEQPSFFGAYRHGSQIRVVLTTAVYRKTLKLGSGTISQITTGRIINILANDMLKFNDATKFLQYLWVGAIVGIVMLVILWLQIGIASLGVIVVLIVTIAFTTIIASFLARERISYLKYADERIKVMNEIITGMRVIKMYAWEKSFAKYISNVRKNEIKHAFRIAYLRAVSISMQFVSPALMLFCSVVVYGLFGNHLDVARIFTVYSLVQGIRAIFMFIIPESIQNIKEASISLKRIEDFLLSDELQPLNEEESEKNRDVTQAAPIQITNLSVWWSDESRPILKDLSFSIKKNELYAIVGPVGSGKSTLLITLLGDVKTFKGQYWIQGNIGYVSQQAWIISDTLRNNILFGQEYDDEKYNQVINACALRKDLELLPNGDMTFVGERGVQLSGGQRMRVHLARAAYYDADVYLLDDPLSAVDVDVANHLYQQCICGLLAKKTRILVTHQLHHLRSADQIIVLNDGSIEYIDTFENLQLKSSIFSMPAQEQSPDAENDYRKIKFVKLYLDTPNFEKKRTESYANNKDKNGQVIEKEIQKTGSVSWRFYMNYFVSAFGVIPSAIALVIFFLTQASLNVTDWWFSRWSTAYQNASLSNNGSITINTVILFELSNLNVVGIYAGLLGISIALVFLRSWILARMAVKASEQLENKLFQSILRTVIHVFDTYPSGLILNRFSKDCAQMDDNIGYSLMFTVQCILLIFGQILTTAIINPWMLIPIVIVTIPFLILRKYYLNLSRDVKRLEAAGSSPIYSHVSTTLQGLTTLRSYGASSRFLQEFQHHLDRHTQSWITFISSIRWNSFHADFLSALLVAGVAFGLVLLPEGSINVGLAALIISYSTNLLGVVNWTIRTSSELENQMTSVERVDEYTKLPKEKEFYQKDDPKSEWPKFGRIKFEDVSFAHSEHLPLVLKSISCEIKQYEKIGIVGRTGAGKSSLIASMFRLAEPRGKILIDDVVINNIGLNCLRSAISVIPQDPVLFIGTIRKNLDPFNCYNDDQLWKALHEVEMGAYVSQLPNKLSNEVAEFGANFSIGQRQLLCLARAILKNNRILLIDEATANVDLATDAIIQRTLRDKFINCSVLVIAHRLSTIIDCDRVMVIEAGRIVEFDSPYVLLQSDGYFNKLVNETGTEESRNLRHQAENYHHD